MFSTDFYITHHLNNSLTKQTHTFSKSQRFTKKKRSTSEFVYHLPTTKSRRTTSFGIGQKCPLLQNKNPLPPGTYRVNSDFQRKQYSNVTSIAPGRQKVTFGSFLLEALKKNKNSPSPDRYNPVIKRSSVGGLMAQRIKTQPIASEKKSMPGPGTYKLTAIELANQGRYALSSFKNASSPRYFSTLAIQKTAIPQNQPMQCARSGSQSKQFGKYPSSKNKNLITRTFPKSIRAGLQDKSKLHNPSFKYRKFSQFGSYV